MDKIEFKLINAYELGEPWTREFEDEEIECSDCNDKCFLGIAVLINGEDIIDLVTAVRHPNEFQQYKYEFGHISPDNFCRDINLAIDAETDFFVAACGNCGYVSCRNVSAIIIRESGIIKWTTSVNFGCKKTMCEDKLCFVFDEAAFDAEVAKIDKFYTEHK